ncbi:MAG TPA: hypothetical protein VMM60_16360 [Ilumatobacter sp.]|nr:hypothetical protein [Ilumatobacter sp.]
MEAITVPAYHAALRSLLEPNHPELWRWFAESLQPSADDVAHAALGILKTSYRLDGDVHAALAGLATVLAGRIGLDCDVVLYQALVDRPVSAGARNAQVVVLGDTAHLVFAGDMLALLDVAEQEAVLAHELAHVWLQRTDGGAMRVLDQLVHRIDAESDESVLAETARRLRLHTEVFADRVAVEAITLDGMTEADAETTLVRALVKVHTGLQNVDAAAYLRQARQILESNVTVSEGWTHPELHVRIACITARRSASIDEVMHQLIDGADDLDRLDLLAQHRLQVLSARVLAGAVPKARVIVDTPDDDIDVHLAHLDSLDFDGATPLDDSELLEGSASVRHLAAALILDIAMLLRRADADLDDLNLFTAEAHRIGVADQFDALLARTQPSRKRNRSSQSTGASS